MTFHRVAYIGIKEVESNYKVTFGITKPRDVQPFVDFTAHEGGHVLLSAMGTDGIVFWFLCSETEKHDGTNIPRYTEKDVPAAVKEHGDKLVTNGWTVRELYEDSTITGAAPIVEHEFARWHYKRILTIGDSAHVVSMPSSHHIQIFKLSHSRLTP